MVFRAKGRKAWKARVRHPDGRSRVCGCDTDLKATAKQMEQWAKQLYNDRTPHALSVLDAIVSGRTSLPRAFDSRYDLKALVRDMDDVDLEPYVVRWQRELARRGKPTAEIREKYLTQLRRLIPAGQPFLRSQFTKQAVREWLESLAKPTDGRKAVTQTNRYRAALSSFAQFLAFEDVLQGNPVRLVSMQRENDARLRYLVQLDAKKLAGKFEDRRMEALHLMMLATGMEISAALDVDPAQCAEGQVFAKGKKGGAKRERTARVYSRWQWAWNRARAFILEHPDGSRPFGGISRWSANDALRSALKAAGLDVKYTQHDHRHTWAVQAIRDGIDTNTVAYQLGHKNDLMVRKVYGRFIPEASDYEKKVTPRAPAPEVPHEV